MNQSWRHRIFPLLLALCVASFGGFAWLVGAYRSESSRLTARSAERARGEAARGSQEIERNLRRIMGLAAALAADLRAGAVPAGALTERIRGTVYADPDLAEMGVAFTPFAFDPALRLHGVAFAVRGLRVEPVALDASRDYTEPGTDWYLRPSSEGPVWLEPAIEPVSGALTATYAIPFERPGGDKAPGGVVYVTYALAHLGALLDSLDLGEAGYVCVLSAGGHFLAHPNRDRLDGRTVIADTAGGRALAVLSAEAIAGRASIGAVGEDDLHDQAWAAFAPIPAAGWSIGAVVERESGRSPEPVRRALLRIGLALAVALALGAALVARVDRGGARSFWVTSAAVAALCLGCTVYVLSVVYRLPDAARSEAAISSKSSLRRFVLEQDRKAIARGGAPPIPLPTGLMIQSITFLSSMDIRVTGYLWQRYQDGAHDGIARGFLIPESDSLDVVETYRERAGDTELVGWTFKATLHQNFDYSRFPFGEERVKIPFWPRDFSHGVLLVPDLDAYTQVSPRVRPGLREGLVMPSWDVDETVFSYAPRTYRTRFGFSADTPQANLPELEFDIIGKKQINGPFVTYLLPITVVMIMAYSILVLSSRDERRLKLLGFDALKVITACAGFFLVVIFSQIDLRKTLATRAIVYLECFHLTAYVAILLVAINSILFARTDEGLLHHGDNFFPKLLFWPVIQLVILTFTLLTFY